MDKNLFFLKQVIYTRTGFFSRKYCRYFRKNADIPAAGVEKKDFFSFPHCKPLIVMYISKKLKQDCGPASFRRK